MPQAQKNGRTGGTQTIDKMGRAHTLSVSRTASEQSTLDEEAYNLNTGLITLTSADESGLFYYKHNETKGFDITSLIVIMGPSTGGVTTDTTHVRIYKNPTTGTLISGATAVDINSNRHFSSADTLSLSLAYKGAEGSTITDGSSHIETLISPGNRIPIPISETLKKGNSIAVSLEPNDSNTSMKVMIAMVGHLTIDTSDR